MLAEFIGYKIRESIFFTEGNWCRLQYDSESSEVCMTGSKMKRSSSKCNIIHLGTNMNAVFELISWKQPKGRKVLMAMFITKWLGQQWLLLPPSLWCDHDVSGKMCPKEQANVQAVCKTLARAVCSCSHLHWGKVNSKWKRHNEGLVRWDTRKQNNCYIKEPKDCALISQGKWSERDSTTLFKYQMSKKWKI